MMFFLLGTTIILLMVFFYLVVLLPLAIIMFIVKKPVRPQEGEDRPRGKKKGYYTTDDADHQKYFPILL